MKTHFSQTFAIHRTTEKWNHIVELLSHYFLKVVRLTLQSRHCEEMVCGILQHGHLRDADADANADG